jgi:tyrosyl-tRNA synthetase
MFGKIMALRDELIIKYFTLCTDLSLEEIKVIEQELASGTNPRDIKMRLATEIVTLYHNEKEAALAKNNFIETFQKGGVPETTPEIQVTAGENFADVLVREGIVTSKTDWKRLVADGAVTEMEGETLTDANVQVKNGTFKIGKKRFVKVVIS